ncbi:MAG: helix-turn-helix domain-containing protein [Lachnospiraceae bacterium]|nr:helix-turn-helix domain-containing protein [Lachnospiraceae bacterium]
MDSEKIGHFLKELRKEKGLTQEQLSEKLGVTNRSISRWENGVNMPDLDLVIEIVNYFNVSIEEFLLGERRTEMVDKKTEETVLSVADYSNDKEIIFTKRLQTFLVIGTISCIIYTILKFTGVYENVADFTLGFGLSMLIVGILYTSRYMSKISAFKQRVIDRNK